MYIRGLIEGHKEMGYALFAQRKRVLDMQLNTVQLMQTQRSNEQYALATQTLGLNRQLSALQASQAGDLAEMYQRLSEADQDDRQSIEDEIAAKELEHQREQETINNQIYEVSVKENAIEMEVKRLDTMVTTLQQQLKAVEEAEGSAIERATPKFAGVG
jgi:hypothetical protein